MTFKAKVNLYLAYVSLGLTHPVPRYGLPLQCSACGYEWTTGHVRAWAPHSCCWVCGHIDGRFPMTQDFIHMDIIL